MSHGENHFVCAIHSPLAPFVSRAFGFVYMDDVDTASDCGKVVLLHVLVNAQPTLQTKTAAGKNANDPRRNV